MKLYYWMLEVIQLTSFNQLECFVSVQNSYSQLKFVSNIGSCFSFFLLCIGKKTIASVCH